jgi:predicted dehydrogenase
VRGVIVGCGLIGKKRAESIPEDIKLVGCFDSDPATLDHFSKYFHVQSYSNLEDLFLLEDLSFVIIATQHESLSKIAKLAISKGISVFVEKPGAISFDELKSVTNLSKSKNTLVHVGYNHRFHPAIIKAQELVSINSIGSIMFIRGRYGHGGRIGYETEWRADKSKSGGGELIDQGAHLIEIAQHFLGDVAVDYAATPTYFWKMDVEDNVFISLINEFGCIAFLQASCTEWKNMFSLEIYGKNGKLDISGLGRSYGQETITLHQMAPEMGPPNSQTWTYTEPDLSWQIELNQFMDDLKFGTRKSDNLESSLKVLSIIQDIYVRTGRC